MQKMTKYDCGLVTDSPTFMCKLNPVTGKDHPVTMAESLAWVSALNTPEMLFECKDDPNWTTDYLLNLKQWKLEYFKRKRTLTNVVLVYVL